MKLTINAKTLNAALTDLKRYAAATTITTIPILTTCHMSAADGNLTLQATDLKAGLTLNLPAAVQESGATCIDIRTLAAALKGIKSDIDITVADEQAHITSTAAFMDIRVPATSPAGFPEIPPCPTDAVTLPLSGLKRMIHQTVFCIAKEESRFTLNGALFQSTGETLRMVATDGHRLSVSESPFTTPTFCVIVLAFTLRELERLKSEVVEFAHDDNHVWFRTADRTIVSRKLTGTFPDWERIMPTAANTPNILHADRLPLLSVLQRAIALSTDKRKTPVRFHLNSTIRLETAGENSQQTTLPGVYIGTELDFSIDARYLLEYMQSIPGDLQLRVPNPVKGQVQAALFADLDRYKHVIMPMRV